MHRLLRLSCLFVCAVLTVACAGRGVYVDAAAYVAAHPAAAPAPEVIRPGDRISVKVFGEPNLSVDDALVRPSGKVSMPLLGDQPVVGLSTQALGKNLEKALESYLKDPNVTVFLQPAPLVVHVMGEIASGGRKEYRQPVRLVEVLAESGSLSQFANRSGIYLLRNGTRIRFRYRDILRGSKPERDFYVQDKDVIVVE